MKFLKLNHEIEGLIGNGLYLKQSEAKQLNYPDVIGHLCCGLISIGYDAHVLNSTCIIDCEQNPNAGANRELFATTFNDLPWISKSSAAEDETAAGTIGFLKMNGEMLKLFIPEISRVFPGAGDSLRCDLAKVISIKKSSKDVGDMKCPYFFKEGEWIKSSGSEQDINNRACGISYYSTYKKAQENKFHCVSFEQMTKTLIALIADNPPTYKPEVLSQMAFSYSLINIRRMVKATPNTTQLLAQIIQEAEESLFQSNSNEPAA